MQRIGFEDFAEKDTNAFAESIGENKCQRRTNTNDRQNGRKPDQQVAHWSGRIARLQARTNGLHNEAALPE
ncbi:hypothetical protein D9M70_593300 [compost metagenome]